MNALPHIGSTISQRAMLRHYKLQQRELEAERIAAERTDALLDSIHEPEPCNFCAPVEDVSTPLFSAGEAVILALMLGASVAIYFASVMGWLA